MKAGFSANGHDDDDDDDEDYDYGDSCDIWSNLQVKLKITISCEESAQTDDALPPCKEQDIDQLLSVMNSNTDEYGDDPSANDCKPFLS